MHLAAELTSEMLLRFPPNHDNPAREPWLALIAPIIKLACQTTFPTES
jgi:hypothetical protein